jgi:hypothetical protein
MTATADQMQRPSGMRKSRVSQRDREEKNKRRASSIPPMRGIRETSRASIDHSRRTGKSIIHLLES